MEKKVLLKDLVEFGSNIRREFIPTAVVSSNGEHAIGEFWDANKTIDVIVNNSHKAHDNIRELDEYTHAEETRAKAAEKVLEDTKQDNLVSGENIKTVAGQSILGSGNLVVDYTTLSNKPDLSVYLTQHLDLSSIIARIEALEQAIATSNQEPS